MEWAVALLVLVLIFAPSKGDKDTYNVCIGKCDTIKEESTK